MSATIGLISDIHSFLSMPSSSSKLYSKVKNSFLTFTAVKFFKTFVVFCLSSILLRGVFAQCFQSYSRVFEEEITLATVFAKQPE